MASEDRRAARTLTEALAAGDPGFEFVQAALGLRRLRAELPETRDVLGPGPTRYAVDRSAAFPASEVEWVGEEVEVDGVKQLRRRLKVSFFALAGLTGPLPAAYAELVKDREGLGDHALSDFLEIFESRLVDLFLLAHLRSRFWQQDAWLRAGPSAVGEARVSWGDGRGLPFEQVLFSLIGTYVPELRERVGIPEAALLHYSGLLAQRPCSMSGLQSVLEGYFGVRVTIEPFHGRWVDLPDGSGSTLGKEQGGCLGRDFMLGDRFFDASTGFRLVLGPMKLATFQEYLPGSPGAEALLRLVRFAVGPDLAFDYVLILRAEDVPPAHLTYADEGPQRLGWTLWLQSGDEVDDGRSGPHGSDALDPSAHEAVSA